MNTTTAPLDSDTEYVKDEPGEPAPVWKSHWKVLVSPALSAARLHVPKVGFPPNTIVALIACVDAVPEFWSSAVQMKFTDPTQVTECIDTIAPTEKAQLRQLLWKPTRNMTSRMIMPIGPFPEFVEGLPGIGLRVDPIPIKTEAHCDCGPPVLFVVNNEDTSG